MISDETLKMMCKDAGIKEGIYNNERFFFTLKQVNNFYYDGRIIVGDIVDGFVDKKGDGGIDFMLVKDEQLIIVQGKTGNITKELLEEAFNKVKTTIKKIDNNDFSNLNPDMYGSFINYRQNLEEPNNIKIVLFSEKEISEELQKHFETYDKYNDDYEIEIYDKNEIEERIADLDPNRKVEFDVIKIDDANNVLKYGNGIIVNISANSLKLLYATNRKKGIFSYNLRGKIGGELDTEILNTISAEPEEFWYKNNGILIGCENFEIDEKSNSVKLKNFSIINGAQTTTNIHSCKDVVVDNDFYLVCKIIKIPNGISLEESKDYLQQISVATNSQKKITPQDKKANDILQVRLKQYALYNSHPFEIAIKRPIEYKVEKLKTWQKIENTLLGQLILACICQVPGTAKTSKGTIMENEKYYNYVYNRPLDSINIDNYYDLVLLYNKYIEFKSNLKKEIGNMEEDEKDDESLNQFFICKEGVFCVLATIYYLLGKEKKKNGNKMTCPIEDKKIDDLDFKVRIFNINTYDEINDKIFDIFTYIIEQISMIYNDNRIPLDLSNQAYFMKNNAYYYDYIIKKVSEIYKQKKSGSELRKLFKEVFCTD